jgi:hypothetical protein
MKIALASAAALFAGAAGSQSLAAKTETPARQCFYTRNADSFAAADENTLYVRVGIRDVWQFDMFGRCPDIDWNQRLVLRSRASSWICSGMDAEVITHSPGIGRQHCFVRSVRKLTPEEVAALPRRARP